MKRTLKAAELSERFKKVMFPKAKKNTGSIVTATYLTKNPNVKKL